MFEFKRILTDDKQILSMHDFIQLMTVAESGQNITVYLRGMVIPRLFNIIWFPKRKRLTEVPASV